MRKKAIVFLAVMLLTVICALTGISDGTIAARLKYDLYFAMARQIFPVCIGYMELSSDEEDFLDDSLVQVESDLSYETVLAMEEADENYVDEETGMLVERNDNVLDVTEEEILNDALAVQQNTSAGTELSMEQLRDFNYLIGNFYVVDKNTSVTAEELNADTFLAKDMRLTGSSASCQILIYHTHSQERYADSVEGDKSTYILGVGEYLAELLRGRGINVLHHMGEYDVKDRDSAYASAGPALEQILKENPSIEVVIDLHRDGVAEGTRLVTEIGGKQTATVMFFNGLSRTTATGDIAYLYNPNLQDNLAFSFQMQKTAMEKYPGFTRPVYLKGYRYNMHYCPRSLLVEVGAQTNTVEEAMNAMEPLSEILYSVLVGQ